MCSGGGQTVEGRAVWQTEGWLLAGPSSHLAAVGPALLLGIALGNCLDHLEPVTTYYTQFIQNVLFGT